MGSLCILFFFLDVKNNILSAQNKSKEVIRDASFQDGFIVSPLDPDIVRKGGGVTKTFKGPLKFNNSTTTPSWRIHQWFSKYSLENAKPIKGLKRSVKYENEGKRVTLHKDNSLELEIMAANEWGNEPRKKGEDWPHLLIAQDFSKSTPAIGELENLIFTVEIKLEKCEKKMPENTFNPKLHTAHTPLYFIVRNDNKQSVDFGQKFWLGIHSFDYRYPELKHENELRKDKGTSSYMYNVPPHEFWGNVNFNDLKWHKGTADLLPHIKEAIEIMKKNDIFNNSSLDDLKITGMNFGWEVPGIFNGSVRIKNLSLTAVNK